MDPVKQIDKGSGTEQKSDAGKGGGEKQVDVSARLAALEAENKQLVEVAKGATKEAEGAKAYVASLMSTLQNAAENGAGPLAGGEGGEQVDIKERFAEDPLRVMEEHYQARTAPLVEASQKTLADQNREIARLNLSSQRLWEGGPTVWDKYGKEIDEFMGQFKPEIRAQSSAYEAAVRWVRTKHIDDELKERLQHEKEKEKVAFMEGASGGASGSKPKKPTLSDDEKRIAKKLGVSEEDYMRYRDSDTGEATA
jgi:hypothetical protein